MNENQLYPNLSKYVDIDNVSTHSKFSNDDQYISNHLQISPCSSRNNFDDFDSICDSIEDHTKLTTERKKTFKEITDEIERETLESSLRSLQLLDESEKVGVATAEELYQQREQLLTIEKKLDGIDSTLQTSERHIRGIKSVFGGIRNRISRKKDSIYSAVKSGSSSIQPNECPNGRSNSKNLGPSQDPRGGLFESKLSPKPEGEPSKPKIEKSSNETDKILNENLDQMSVRLKDLKGLGLELNEEIKGQNQILDRMATKTTNTDLRIQGQNAEMKRILK